MTKESLAALLTGREYRKFDLTKEEAEQASAAGLVAVFGYSDDNLEFRGAIRDEIGAYEGVTAVLYKKGKNCYGVVPDDRETIREIDHDHELEAALAARRTGQTVRAIWAPKVPNATWFITTQLPCAAFDIMEDGGLFCRGLVLDVADLK
jgi:hypothetical protein